MLESSNRLIWFFDIDDTLINTAALTETSASGIRAALLPFVGEPSARKIEMEFISIFSVLMAHHRSKTGKEYDEIFSRIQAAQPDVVRAFGRARKWSREVLVKLAAENAGVRLAAEAILAGADGYWRRLTEQMEILPGVLELMRAIEKRKEPVFLLTSSDSRFNVSNEGVFTYVPALSEQFKKNRLAKLREKGISYADIAIGDPEDKPGEDFFRKGLRMAERSLKRDVDPAACVMVGDSFAHDLLTPLEKLGFGFGILVTDSQENDVQPNEKLLITNNLGNVVSLLQ